MLFSRKNKKDKFLDYEKELFDQEFYKNKCSNLNNKNELFEHFHTYGWKNGLDPNNWFSCEEYLKCNPDVLEAGMEPFYHYIRFGIKEKRSLKISTDVEKTDINPIKHLNINFPKSTHLYSKNILIIAELVIPQCKLYRVDQKKLALEKLGYDVNVISWTDRDSCIKYMQTCSVVIFYRVPYNELVKSCYDEAKRLDIQTIFDIDDLIFNEDIYSETLRGMHISDDVKKNLINGVKLYRDAMLAAQDNWFSTKVLCDVSDSYYRTNSFCVENCIPEELSAIAKEQIKKNDNSVVSIFYGAGSSTHDADMKIVQKALEHILEKNNNVELVLLGDVAFNYKNFDILKKIRRIQRLELKDYYYVISQCDIAIIPLENNLFNSAKSNIKYIEASMFNIPSVASDLCEYSSVIKHGENGYIARNYDDWICCIQKLIDDKNLRLSLGKAANTTVQTKYSIESLCKKIQDRICKYTKNSRKSILVVNILYGVSSFGGATVVAEKLAEEIQNNSDYDVHVFSTYSDQNEPLGMLRRYAWNGVNVFAVNIQGVNWNFENKQIADIFANVLDVVSPTLVHFHCIQTLGMNLCETCYTLNIPYVITIHDGWWRCARQFMLDLKGVYCGDENVSSCLCRKRCNIQDDVYYQRKHLADITLSKALYVYTPSDFFTRQIKKDFAFLNVKTNRNGIIYPCNEKNVLESKNNSLRNEKIILGFFGGREIVKGYFFLKDCLEKYKRKDEFEIILIDTSKRNGFEGCIKDDVWPVESRIIGYVKHDKMCDIYKKVDVLIFPSLWKESFGLMVREAIKNNVYVVCSECGGPSEAVNVNNGLVFPIGDDSAFLHCLDTLIKRKDYIKSYKTSDYGDIRTFADQAIELIEDYKKILLDKKL